VDLYLIHWPVSWTNEQTDFDNLRQEALFPFTGQGGTRQNPVSLTDTWAAMERLVDAGLAKAIGLCNCTVEQLRSVLAVARVKPAAHQVECHPALPQRELKAAHAEHGIVLQAYCPLGIGMGSDTTNSLLKNPKVEEIAKQHHMTAAELLLRWNITEGNVTLSKSVTPERIVANAATASEPLPEAAMKALNEFGEKNPLRVGNPKMMHETERPFFAAPA
jgi:diketogulonate reductase-like aldo/keto reductase